MKAYVYKYVSPVSDEYHSGGGVVVVTNRQPVEVWREYAADLDNGDNALEGEAPDAVFDVVTEADEQVFVFADSGCC